MQDNLVISATVIVVSVLWFYVIKPWLDSRPPRAAFVRPRCAGERSIIESIILKMRRKKWKRKR